MFRYMLLVSSNSEQGFRYPCALSSFVYYALAEQGMLRSFVQRICSGICVYPTSNCFAHWCRRSTSIVARPTNTQTTCRSTITKPRTCKPMTQTQRGLMYRRSQVNHPSEQLIGCSSNVGAPQHPLAKHVCTEHNMILQHLKITATVKAKQMVWVAQVH